MGLSKEVWLLVLLNTVMQTIFIFTGIFVNLYLWGANQNLANVILFNLVSNTVLFFAYVYGSHLLYKRSIRFVLAISCIFAAIAFTALLFYTPGNRYVIVPLVGALVGVTQGFFWGGNNAAMYAFLKSEDYPNYFSANTVMQQILSILVPLISSGLILWLSFRGSFLFMGVLVIGALVFVVKFPKFAIQKSLFVHIRYRDVFSRPGTRWVMLGVLAIGVIGQFQQLFTLIFTFNVTHNEVLVALLNVGYAIVVFAALFLYKRVQIHENLWLVIGIVFILLAYVGTMLHHRASLAIGIVLLMQVGGMYFAASSGRQSYRVMMQDDIVWRTQFGMWQEVSFFVSRVLVLGIALAIHHIGDLAFIIVVVLSTVSLFLMPLFQHKSIVEFEQVHGQGAGM